MIYKFFYALGYIAATIDVRAEEKAIEQYGMEQYDYNNKGGRNE